MNKERLHRIEEYFKAGHYTPELMHELLDEVNRSDNEVLRLECAIDELKDEINMHRSNYDEEYWNEKEREWKEDGLE